MSRPARAVLTLAAAVLALNLLLYGLRELTPEPSGPPSSAYSTTPEGAAAWAELLERRGHRVRRLGEEPAERLPGEGVTVVLVSPRSLEDEDAEALAAFARDGGRLVAAGDGLDPLVAALGVTARPAAGGIERAVAVGDAPRFADVRTVETRDEGAWTDAGTGEAVLGEPGRDVLLALHDVGEGEVALLADASPLRNGLLDRADNAALALALAGDDRRPVAFVESVHGFRAATGLAALPASWKAALVLLVLAGLVALLAYGRRLGPPERSSRPLPPPRRLYVSALAATLRRTGDPVAATANVRAAARDAVARRAGLGPDAPEEAVLAAARRVGLDRDEVAALREPPTGQDPVLAGGRALAKLTRGAG